MIIFQHPILTLLGDYSSFLYKSLEILKKIDLPEEILCDHICYRVKTINDYDTLKAKLLVHGELAAETIVRGRPISIFKLTTPIIFENLRIDCIELPAPKDNNSYDQGWEHIEIVIKDLESFMIKNSHLTFETKGLNRKLNPEIAISVCEEFKIKFHPLHILDVIEIESK